MKLTGLGKDKDGKYAEEEIGWDRPDELLCLEVCRAAGLPEYCADHIGVVVTQSKPKDLDVFWTKLQKAIFDLGGTRVEPGLATNVREEGSLRKWTFLLRGRQINAGVQRGKLGVENDTALYAIVNGEVNLRWDVVHEIEYGDVTNSIRVETGSEQCVYDLQDGDRDAYYIGSFKAKGNAKKVFFFFGSGWYSVGWPVFHEIGKYPGIVGESRDKLFAELNNEHVPNFDPSVYKITDFVIIEHEEVTECKQSR